MENINGVGLMISGIYYIKSPSNKYYIGSTKNFVNRKKRYARGDCKKQHKIYNSIMKYGWEQHEWGVLDHCSEDVLIEREQMCIDFYKPELNISKFASCPFRGRTHTEKTKKKLALLKKGKRLSEEHKKKLSEARKIPVVQYDKENRFIKEWPSAKDAQKTLGIRHITDCCRGSYKSAGGFVWRYKDL